MATRRSASEAGAIDAAARVLAGGGLVAFPTETVYGLGAETQDLPGFVVLTSLGKGGQNAPPSPAPLAPHAPPL